MLNPQRVDPEIEAVRIEAELIHRHLAKTRLKHFVERFTPNYVPGFHLDEIAAACERMEQLIQRGKGTSARLILEAPPRHGKSQTTSRCFPLWYLGRHPEQEIIVATYGQDLADDLGRWAKGVLKDPAFVAMFPDLKLRKDSQAANRLDTTKGGGIRYVGVGTSLTGRGGHLIICDDLVKDSEAADSEAVSESTWNWYTSVLRTRLAPGGGIVVMHTRWRLNDPIGRLLEAEKEGGEKWERITFSMEAKPDDPWGRQILPKGTTLPDGTVLEDDVGEPLHPDRFDVLDMLALKRSLPPRDWLSLYQQDPFNETGNIFKIDDFHLYKPGTQPKNLNWHIAGDGAFSQATHADFSVIWPYGIDSDGVLWFSPDFVHAKIPTDVFVDDLFRLAKSHKAQSLVLEKGAHFQAVKGPINRRMRRTGTYFMVDNPPAVADKVTRSRPLHAMMRQGMVRFPDTNYMRQVVIPEFLVFSGKNDEHDDCVDTASHAAVAAETQVSATEEDDEIDVDFYSAQEGAWNINDIQARIYELNEPPDPRRRHIPKTIRGEQRKSGARRF